MLSVLNKEVVIEENTIVEKPISDAKKEDFYDANFVAMMKKRIAKEKFTPITTKSIWESIWLIFLKVQ